MQAACGVSGAAIGDGCATQCVLHCMKGRLAGNDCSASMCKGSMVANSVLQDAQVSAVRYSHRAVVHLPLGAHLCVASHLIVYTRKKSRSTMSESESECEVNLE